RVAERDPSPALGFLLEPFVPAVGEDQHAAVDHPPLEAARRRLRAHVDRRELRVPERLQAPWDRGPAARLERGGDGLGRAHGAAPERLLSGRRDQAEALREILTVDGRQRVTAAHELRRLLLDDEAELLDRSLTQLELHDLAGDGHRELIQAA